MRHACAGAYVEVCFHAIKAADTMHPAFSTLGLALDWFGHYRAIIIYEIPINIFQFLGP